MPNAVATRAMAMAVAPVEVLNRLSARPSSRARPRHTSHRRTARRLRRPKWLRGSISWPARRNIIPVPMLPMMVMDSPGVIQDRANGPMTEPKAISATPSGRNWRGQIA